MFQPEVGEYSRETATRVPGQGAKIDGSRASSKKRERKPQLEYLAETA